jgi:hypothetical protein
MFFRGIINVTRMLKTCDLRDARTRELAQAQLIDEDDHDVDAGEFRIQGRTPLVQYS